MYVSIEQDTKLGVDTRYGARITSLPKRKLERVKPPDFFESYAKYACAYKSVFSPMILIVFLLAPIVPSDPKPKNKASVT